MKKTRMLRLLSLFLCLLVFVSCNNGEGNNETEESTDTVEKYVPSESELLLVADEQAYCGIVRPKEISKDLMTLCTELSKTVEESTGVKVEMVSDKNQLADGMVEILIGDTNRSESTQARKALGRYEYSVSVINGKVVAVGSDDVMLENAIRQLIDMIDLDPEQLSRGIWTFPLNYGKKFDGSNYQYNAYIGKGYELTSKYELIPGLSTDRDIVSGELTFPWTQGGCTDGKNYYCLMLTHSSSAIQRAVILKYDLATQTLLKQSDPLPMDHANDAAYNPHNNTLIVIGGGVNHFVLDADTLQIVNMIPARFSSGVVCYDPDERIYIIGNTYTLCYYDEDFNFLREIRIPGMLEEFDTETGLCGSQGMTRDGKYIYYLENWVNKNNNRQHRCNIVIYDVKTGVLIDRVPLYMGCEVEHIFIWENSFYITCNNLNWDRALCYKVDLVPQV